MRILMLSIEIDRKDTIIRELLEQASGEDSRRIIEELTLRCNKYEVEKNNLHEQIHILNDNISSIEIKNKELLTSVSFSEELESKIMKLENKLRRAEEEKIDLEEQVRNNQVNQTMAEYNIFRQ